MEGGRVTKRLKKPPKSLPIFRQPVLLITQEIFAFDPPPFSLSHLVLTKNALRRLIDLGAVRGFRRPLLDGSVRRATAPQVCCTALEVAIELRSQQ